MADNKMITIRDYMSAPAVIKKMQEMFQTPGAIQQFSTAVVSISGADPLLQNAEPRSLFNACLTAASLNLPINKNLGFAHIIGFKNNRKGGIVEAQFLMGARGYKELAQRSGRYKVINQGDVRKGELVGRNRLTGEIDFNWVEDDDERQKLPVVGYFSYFQLDNGFTSTFYMSKQQVTEHAQKYSQSFKSNYGPWKDNFDAMALKTVSKLNISKNGPMSIEMQKAVNVDQAVIKDDGTPEYIDGETVQTDDDRKARIQAAAEAKAAEMKRAEHVPAAVDTVAEVTDEELEKLGEGKKS